MTSSSGGRSKPSGATRTPGTWPATGTGWSVPTSCPTSRSWSGGRSAGPSPGRSSSGSSSTSGTLAFLTVHTGRMEAACVQTKDAAHYVAALRLFHRRHRHLRGVYLIHDNDGSHIAGETQDYLRKHRRWWRVCPTP